jgi:hypothetical protein
MVFQSFTAETAEFAEKIPENSAFSRALCGEKILSHSVDKPSMYFENSMCNVRMLKAVERVHLTIQQNHTENCK